MSKFKQSYAFKFRLDECNRIILKFPDRIPIICEKNPGIKDTPDIDKSKYLVPYDLTVSQFLLVIRKKMKLPPERAIFLFVNDKMISGTQIISTIYQYEKDPDGFLYIGYSSENTFG